MGSEISHSPKFRNWNKNSPAAFTHAANFESSNEANTRHNSSKVEEIHRQRVIMSKSPNIFAQNQYGQMSPKQNVFPSVASAIGEQNMRTGKLDKQVTQQFLVSPAGKLHNQPQMSHN